MWNKLIFWTHIFCTSVAHHSAGRIHPAVRCTLRCHQTWQGKSTVTCHGGGFTWESSRTCKQSSIIWLMILVEYKNHIKSMIIKSLNHPTKWWLIFFQQTTQFLDIHGAWDSSDFITTCIIGASKLCSCSELVPTPKVCRAEARRTCRKPLRTKGAATGTSFCGAN